ncbi:MAG: beta-lactamase family protein [Acidimicrobiia bacterium]|nr:beta-lactamase family protein [Acidimicrobiia bacterium]
MTDVEIHGTVHRGFEAVAEAMAANFVDPGEVGAAAAAFVEGEAIVDIWAGRARPEVPWARDTIVPVFSATKGAAALVIHVLADRGALDIQAPIARYWPEFAQHGKESVTVEHVLTHTSGVLRVDDYLPRIGDGEFLNDLDRIADTISACRPDFEPGSRVAYQAVTYGYILGEVVRRVDGRTLGKVWREEIAEPFGIDFWIGLPPEEHNRVAELYDAPPPQEPAVQFYLAMFTPDTLQGQAMMVDQGGFLKMADRANDPAALTAEIPAAGGVGSAVAMATWYAILANGGALHGRRLVTGESIATHSKERSTGNDLVSMMDSRFALGYALPTPLSPYVHIEHAFGHSGFGGSVGFADPSRRLSFGYAMNQLRLPAPDEVTRAERLITALYESL